MDGWKRQLISNFKILQQGMNLESIEICKTYVEYEEAVKILKKNTGFDLSLRSACLDFFVSAFVDPIVEESGVDIDNIWHGYVSIY